MQLAEDSRIELQAGGGPAPTPFQGAPITIRDCLLNSGGKRRNQTPACSSQTQLFSRQCPVQRATLSILEEGGEIESQPSSSPTHLYSKQGHVQRATPSVYKYDTVQGTTMLTFKQFLLHEANDPWRQIDVDGRPPQRVLRASQEIRKSPSNQLKGVGANSFVYHNQDDGQNLDNVSRVASSEDGADRGYRIYADFLRAHPKLQDNPYLPRIQNVSSDGNVDEYTVERLVPFQSLRVTTVETLLALIERVFTDKIVERIRDTDYTGANELLVIEALSHEILRVLWGCIGKTPGTSKEQLNMMKNYIKDPQLVQAIQAINYLLRTKENTSQDLHAGNVMWRITGRTPQLVLTDPIY